MTDITLTIQEPPDETDLNIVHDGLRAFNARHAEPKSPASWRMQSTKQQWEQISQTA